MATRYVHVLATTDAGTRSALRVARAIASEQGTGVVLLVPRVVSFAVPLGEPELDPAAIADAYRRLADEAGVDAIVRVCFCRERHHVFGRLLIEHADVVVAGRTRWWWATPEERLARRLAAEGHHVTFADVGREASVLLTACRRSSVESV